MSRAGQPWTEAEDQIIVDMARQHPTLVYRDLAQRIAPLIPRTAGAIKNRMLTCSSVRRALNAARAGVAAPPAPVKVAGKVHQVITVTPGDHASSVGVRLPELPFEIERAPRDESRPYERRAFAGSRPARRRDPEQEAAARVAWFKGLLAEMAGGARIHV